MGFSKQAALVLAVYTCFFSKQLRKESLKSDGQQFHQYQQSKQINSDGQQ